MERLLLWAGAILIFSHLLAEGFRRIRLSPVLGAITAGMLLGMLTDVAPPTMAIGRDDPTISFLAEIGILLLLFISGLDLNLVQFKEALRAGTSVAILGVFAPFSLNALLGYAIGLSGRPLLTFASIFTATSVGITSAILLETNSVSEDFGRTILTAAVIDDIIGVILMTIVLSTGSVTMLSVDLALFALCSILAIFFLKKAVHTVHEHLISPYSKMGVVIGIVLLFAYLTETLGLAGISGAFIAGVALSGLRESREIAEIANSLDRDFFLPFFFFTAGSLVNPRLLGHFDPLLLLVIPLTAAGKVLGCGLGARINGVTGLRKWIVGVGMIPMMEVVLILATLAVSRGIFDPTFGAQLMTTVILYILLGLILIPTALPRMIAKARATV